MAGSEPAQGCDRSVRLSQLLEQLHHEPIGVAVAAELSQRLDMADDNVVVIALVGGESDQRAIAKELKPSDRWVLDQLEAGVHLRDRISSVTSSVGGRSAVVHRVANHWWYRRHQLSVRPRPQCIVDG